MSGASPTRAAVFTSSPQSVEIFERGAWWPGSMLGWRHDGSGACQAWVRVEFAGVSEDAWVDLTLLRLPESSAARSLGLAREPRGARGAEAPVDAAETQHLPLVRDAAAPPAGRRVPPTGGRRRAPETAEAPAVSPPPLGRHRAPAELGRHRAADTGMLAAVPAGDSATTGSIGDAVDRWTPPPPRSELPPAGPVVRPPVVRPGLDPDRLTRPMRLDEGVGSARRSRRDSLSV